MSALLLAKRLRAGEWLTCFDSTLRVDADGSFRESSMSVGRDGHYFPETRLSWLTVRRYLKNGAYR